MMATQTEQTPFEHVEQALRWAYRVESVDVISLGQSLKDLYGGRAAVRERERRHRTRNRMRATAIANSESGKLDAATKAQISQEPWRQHPVQTRVCTGNNAAWDRLADAAIIIRVAAENINEPMRTLIETYYTVPEGTLADRKELGCRMLGEALHQDAGRDKWFCVDVVREWCGLKMEHEYQWWAKELQKSEMTIHRWAKGKRENGSLYKRLDNISRDAHRAIQDLFIERGYIYG